MAIWGAEIEVYARQWSLKTKCFSIKEVHNEASLKVEAPKTDIDGRNVKIIFFPTTKNRSFFVIKKRKEIIGCIFQTILFPKALN